MSRKRDEITGLRREVSRPITERSSMSKKLDKKALLLKQAMFCGFAVEAIVSFKVISHYVVIVWSAVLSIPHVVGGAFASICAQIAQVFGA